MRWIVLVVAILACLVLAVFSAGAMLPENHVVSRNIRMKQPPDTVWQVINDHSNEPNWRHDVKKVERLPDRNGHEVWEETDQSGNELQLETTESVPPRRLVRTIVDNNMFGGRWEIEISPADGGTEVKITERGFVHNPFFRFVSQFVIGHTASIDKYLAALADSSK